MLIIIYAVACSCNTVHYYSQIKHTIHADDLVVIIMSFHNIKKEDTADSVTKLTAIEDFVQIIVSMFIVHGMQEQACMSMKYEQPNSLDSIGYTL